MSFETPRLVARPLREEDIPHIVACRSHPEAARYQNWETYSAEQAQELVSEMLLKQPGHSGWYQWVLERKFDSVFVGDCGLKIDPTDHRLAQIGYTISFDYWNQGFATEIVKALTAYAFDTFEIHRITASVDPRNQASCRVLEKTGFRREAHFRKSEWLKDAWVDDAVYALLRDDLSQGAAKS